MSHLPCTYGTAQLSILLLALCHAHCRIKTLWFIAVSFFLKTLPFRKQFIARPHNTRHVTSLYIILHSFSTNQLQHHTFHSIIFLNNKQSHEQKQKQKMQKSNPTRTSTILLLPPTQLRRSRTRTRPTPSHVRQYQ